MRLCSNVRDTCKVGEYGKWEIVKIDRNSAVRGKLKAGKKYHRKYCSLSGASSSSNSDDAHGARVLHPDVDEEERISLGKPPHMRPKDIAQPTTLNLAASREYALEELVICLMHSTAILENL